jgi:hypothetical protein
MFMFTYNYTFSGPCSCSCSCTLSCSCSFYFPCSGFVLVHAYSRALVRVHVYVHVPVHIHVHVHGYAHVRFWSMFMFISMILFMFICSCSWSCSRSWMRAGQRQKFLDTHTLRRSWRTVSFSRESVLQGYSRFVCFRDWQQWPWGRKKQIFVYLEPGGQVYPSYVITAFPFLLTLYICIYILRKNRVAAAIFDGTNLYTCRYAYIHSYGDI